MSWTTFGKDGERNIYSNCEIHILMLLSTPLTELYPVEMWWLFMTRTSQEENGALEELKLLSRDQMVRSGEPLFEWKPKREEPQTTREQQPIVKFEYFTEALLNNDLCKISNTSRNEALRPPAERDSTKSRVPLVLAYNQFNTGTKPILLDNFQMLLSDPATRTILSHDRRYGEPMR